MYLRALLALHPPISSLTSSGQRNHASWASQPQKSVTLLPCPGGRTTKSIRTFGGIGGKNAFLSYRIYTSNDTGILCIATADVIMSTYENDCICRHVVQSDRKYCTRYVNKVMRLIQCNSVLTFKLKIEFVPFKIVPLGGYTPPETLFPLFVATLVVANRNRF